MKKLSLNLGIMFVGCFLLVGCSQAGTDYEDIDPNDVEMVDIEFGKSDGPADTKVMCQGEQHQIIQLNPNAALQKVILKDGLVPTSDEFTLPFEANSYVAQRSEHLASGEVRVYYAQVPNWGDVQYVIRGNETNQLDIQLVQEGEKQHKMPLNPNALLQKIIFANKMVPTSSEFDTTAYNVGFRAQRAENLLTGAVVSYYAQIGQWNKVYRAPRPTGWKTLCSNPQSDLCDNAILMTGMNGSSIKVCAGRDFYPKNCPACVQVKNGVIRHPNGNEWKSVGINLPLDRDSHCSTDSNGAVSCRSVDDPWRKSNMVIRIFGAGNLLSNPNMAGRSQAEIDAKLDEYTERIAKLVDSSYDPAMAGPRFIIVPTDYYSSLVGEPELVPDNSYHNLGSAVNFCGFDNYPQINVRPWKWYKRGMGNFSFVSNCNTHPDNTDPNRFKLQNFPNYEQGPYVRFVEKLVTRLKDHPGVFAWALGNEIRALGRGGAGADAISKQQAVEVFAEFSTDMIQRIRQIDENHLIILGVQNITEVSDSPRYQDAWAPALDRMLQVPFNAWNLTWYNSNLDSEADLREFSRFGIPVIATERDWDKSQFGGTCPSKDELRGWTCAVLQQGAAVAMPWDPGAVEFCGRTIFEDGWSGCGN